MKAIENVTTQFFYPKGSPARRLFALWYFTILMTVWNILGHTILGFEQAWAAPVVAVGTCIVMQFLLEWVDATAKGRVPRYKGGWKNTVNMLPPALIPGFAIGMLLYSNEQLWVLVFCSILAIGSKVLLRAPVAPGVFQHVFNPSNVAVALTFLLFPWVGMAPPYHFVENLDNTGKTVVPIVVLVSGLIVHFFFTGRMPLVAAWIAGFAAQALVRAWLFGMPPLAPLVPMTGTAFIVFTLYMIPDPATTPLKPLRQVGFGLATAAVYGVIQALHLVFGLFFALVLVCLVRGVFLHGLFAVRAARQRQPAMQPALAVGR